MVRLWKRGYKVQPRFSFRRMPSQEAVLNLMVAYLYLDFAAMFVGEFYFASETPLCCMDADGRNQARLAADDVRPNFRTITLDLPDQRRRVVWLVVDADVPAAEVVEVQFGAAEPLAENFARPFLKTSSL
jgi:hypothetical protein